MLNTGLSKYEKHLIKLEISAYRAAKITAAMDQLHMEICALDKISRKIFYQKSLDERMTEFSEIEELIDPRLS